MRFSALNLLAGLLIVSAIAARTLAQDASPPATQIRPDQDLRPLVEEAASRSATIRHLIDQLEHQDVTVYIRISALLPTDLDGRVALLPTGTRQRYLVIELARDRPRIVQMSTLGHELFHATEIAAAPAVIDARTLAAHYASIGVRTASSAGRLTFETQAAAAAGERARQEIMTNRVRTVHGT